MGRPSALTTPAVTVCWNPYGDPMATVIWPMRRSAELPNGRWGRGGAFTRRTARSVSGSCPTRSPGNERPSARVTEKAVPPRTTWELVAMNPSGAVTNVHLPDLATLRYAAALPFRPTRGRKLPPTPLSRRPPDRRIGVCARQYGDVAQCARRGKIEQRVVRTALPRTERESGTRSIVATWRAWRMNWRRGSRVVAAAPQGCDVQRGGSRYRLARSCPSRCGGRGARHCTRGGCAPQDDCVVRGPLYPNIISIRVVLKSVVPTIRPLRLATLLPRDWFRSS